MKSLIIISLFLGFIFTGLFAQKKPQKDQGKIQIEYLITADESSIKNSIIVFKIPPGKKYYVTDFNGKIYYTGEKKDSAYTICKRVFKKLYGRNN